MNRTNNRIMCKEVLRCTEELHERYTEQSILGTVKYDDVRVLIAEYKEPGYL